VVGPKSAMYIQCRAVAHCCQYLFRILCDSRCRALACVFEQEHELFRESVRHFLETEILPNVDEWGSRGRVDKAMFRKAGEAGLLGMAIPEQYGGGGVDDYRFNAVIDEEFTGGLRTEN